MNNQTRTLLWSWVRRPTTPSGLVRRARALLLLEQGYRYTPTAKQVGLTERNLRKWARRFLDRGIDGLHEQPRPGRPLCRQARL
jgi:transposase